MTALDLLSEARRLGATFTIEEGKLYCQVPDGLSPALLGALRERKPEVRALLEEEAARPAPALPPPRCALCGRVKLQIRDRHPHCIPCDGPFGPLAEEEAR